MRWEVAIWCVWLLMWAATAAAQPADDLAEGDRYFEDGDWRRAAAAYDRAIRKYPTQVSAEAYGKRAAIFIIQKDYPGGLTFLRDVAKKRWPDAPEVLEQEALILWQNGNKTDAVTVAEKVVAKKPTAFTNQQLIGEFYAGRDSDKTAAAYEAYLAHRPGELAANDVLPRVRLGFAYLSQARLAIRDGKDRAATDLYGKAVTQFEEVERKHGKKPNARVNADNGLCAAYTGLARHDQAITVCERIIKDPRRIDANGSVWFNLGSAYLAKKQPQKARTAAAEFVRARKGEARGHILIGDAYFQERDWKNALSAYLEAETLLKPSQAREQVTLSIRLGKTYRRTGGGARGGPNLALAIQKLEAGLAGNPGSLELAAELGSAYLAAGQDARAEELVDRTIKHPAAGSASDEARGAVLVIAAKALYNQKKLDRARAAFETVRRMRPRDVEIQRGLVATISAQGYAAFEKKDNRNAQALFEQALAIDPNAALPLLDLTAMAIERKDCDGALVLLGKLADPQSTDLMMARRLEGRARLCATRKDPRKAADAYAAAEKAARNAAANVVLAEVYTEWAPLTWDRDLDGAIEKLQTAVQLGGAAPGVGPAARRNLALALFRRGWRHLRDGKAAAAYEDFERATKDPGLLTGVEPLAFEFSRSLAALEKGDGAVASRGFKALASKGNQASYLRAPYSKVGGAFFAAYASYRTSGLASRQAAADGFAKLQADASGPFARKLGDLLASAYELVALEQWKAGKGGAAASALAAAAKHADAEARRRIANNQAAIDLGRASPSSLESLGAQLPEALVNLGIVYDQQGKPREAYDAWVKARARGAGGRDLQRWIDAKKRIYGF